MAEKLEFWDEIDLGLDGIAITIKDQDYLKDQDYDNYSDKAILNVIYKDGVFKFQEACDRCFSTKMNKEQALKLVDELKEWIESN